MSLQVYEVVSNGSTKSKHPKFYYTDKGFYADIINKGIKALIESDACVLSYKFQDAPDESGFLKLAEDFDGDVIEYDGNSFVIIDDIRAETGIRWEGIHLTILHFKSASDEPFFWIDLLCSCKDDSRITMTINLERNLRVNKNEIK